MKKRLFLFLAAIFFAKTLFAQTFSDTTSHFKIDSSKETQPIIIDSLKAKDSIDTVSQRSLLDSVALQNTTQQKPQVQKTNVSPGRDTGILKKVNKGKDLLFYFLIILLLAFAVLRNLFSKYFGDLFRLFFRTTLKQRQIREQLMQTTLPSLVFNVFFVIVGALYLDLLLQHFNLLQTENFWLLFLYCGIGLSAIYLLKYLGLKLSGWLFNIKGSAESYLFIVFIVNKMMGIFLLPFLILLSFTDNDLYKFSLVVSWIGISGLFLYRFILTFAAVHKQIRVNLFHFFLYLCAFEIAPLLLIYKALLFIFS